MLRFENKRVLITGGTQGMGLATAKTFAKQGASVCITGRNTKSGMKALKELQQISSQTYYIPCDVAESDNVKHLLNVCVEYLGGLDIAFNNAGVSSQHTLLHEADEANWENAIRINICGTFYCMKYELQAMLKDGGGVIINNSSCAGVMAIPKQSAYVASKHAIIGLTKSAAIDYANQGNLPQIRINAIAPGPIEGGMNSPDKHGADSENMKRKRAFTAMHRLGKQEEVANTVLWLASDEASYITGALVPIDGGVTAGKWS